MAIRRAGADPTTTVAIEDTAMPALAARTAGLRVIAVPGELFAGQVAPHAELVVSSLGSGGEIDRDVAGALFGWPPGSDGGVGQRGESNRPGPVCQGGVMRVGGTTRRSRWWCVAVVAAVLVPLGCSGDDDPAADSPDSAGSNVDGAAGGDPGGPATTVVASGGAPDGDADPGDAGSIELGLPDDATHGDASLALLGILPAETYAVATVDLDGLLSGESSTVVTSWLEGDAADPAIDQIFGPIGRITATLDDVSVMRSAVLAHTDPAEGPALIGRVHGESIGELFVDPAPTPAGTYGATSQELYQDSNGNSLALLPGGVLVAGAQPVVESVIDVAERTAATNASPIDPFLGAASGEHSIEFVYGLPALSTDVEPDLTLGTASAMSGALDVADGAIGGEMVFHTTNAPEFVDAYNAVNVPSTAGDEPLEQPLNLADPIVDGLPRVVVPIPPGPLDPAADELRLSRNLFKKLFAGMEADDYASGVGADGNAPWLDFVVQSVADDVTPRSPSSVYIRWEFRDQAAIEEFERNELPEGFRLAPTQFLESDDPGGEYFLALNLYNGAGGSIVGGARAEWDVFVHPPAGADPNAGERPRFFVVQALAEEVSADPGNLLTPAEPVSHELVDGVVVSDVRRFEGDGEVPVFASTFPAPDPAEAEVARFTREMGIGNDYIYWAHGVSDRVLYNATTVNHDAYFVDTSQLEYTDLSQWAQYLKPEVKDAVYYVNTLEYVAQPMNNLDSEFLDITPGWLAALDAFRNNGHQQGLMRAAVEQLFRGAGDPFVGVHVLNETPSTYFHFEITDPVGLEAALDLPPGHTLGPTTLYDGGAEGHYLTLSVYEVDDAAEGTRAEWSVYVDNGNGRPPHLMVVDLMSEGAALDSYRVVELPSAVEHDVTDGVLRTSLASPDVTFEASFETTDVTEHELALDWIEAGDIACDLFAICDLAYYDAETLDVPVRQPNGVTVTEIATPWDEFIGSSPAVVFYRDNAQEYAVKPWYDLDVFVEELPFTGLDDRTHAISGTGSLVGRTSDVADSTYTYTGDAVLDGDVVTFAIDQEVVNALGVGNIYTTGVFDLVSGTGTQTVVDCQGPPLLCTGIENGSTAFYEAQGLDATDLDAITWQVDLVLDLGSNFGIADSASTFQATRDG